MLASSFAFAGYVIGQIGGQWWPRRAKSQRFPCRRLPTVFRPFIVPTFRVCTKYFGTSSFAKQLTNIRIPPIYNNYLLAAIQSTATKYFLNSLTSWPSAATQPATHSLARLLLLGTSTARLAAAAVHQQQQPRQIRSAQKQQQRNSLQPPLLPSSSSSSSHLLVAAALPAAAASRPFPASSQPPSRAATASQPAFFLHRCSSPLLCGATAHPAAHSTNDNDVSGLCLREEDVQQRRGQSTNGKYGSDNSGSRTVSQGRVVGNAKWPNMLEFSEMLGKLVNKFKRQTLQDGAASPPGQLSPPPSGANRDGPTRRSARLNGRAEQRTMPTVEKGGANGQSPSPPNTVCSGDLQSID
jgi:hypothetical protein